MAAGNGAVAAQSLEWARATALAGSPPSRAQAGFSQAAGADPARKRLAHRHLARRHQCLAHLALRRRPRRPAHRDYWRSAPRPEEWFLIEWPQGESEPTKYWLSTLPEDTPLIDLVDQAKLRWRIERDYQELKQEIGLGHYEGRGWRGFHHHAALAIAAYGFLVSERSRIPPSGRRRKLLLKAPQLPEGYRPRGTADPPRTPRRQLHRHHPH